ncbi:ABC transporter ATP-binding protein [soil metagenome]
MSQPLRASVRLRRGSLDLEVEVTAAPGEIVAVLGPNGAGKTTLLRAVAGLTAIDSGRVALGDEVWDEPASGRFVGPERRRVGYVFQDRLLFAHLSNLDNVAFGLRCQGRSRAEARTVAGGWLERVQLGGYAHQRPAVLSGGQAQLVALARALAVEPAVLLLDEPLAALDASTRPRLRAELRRYLTAFDGIRLLVTHDPLDALTLCDRLLVVEGGRVVQTGGPAEVAARPRSAYVADLVGLNLFRGTASVGSIAVAGGGALVAAGEHRGEVFAVVHPRAVALHRAVPHGSPRNVWAGRVAEVDLVGDRVRVVVAGAPRVVAEVTPAAVAELGLAAGCELWVSIKATEIGVYPA